MRLTIGSFFSIFTEKLNVLYERNWTRLVDEQLRLFEARIAEAVKNQQTSTTGTAVDLHWSFPTSLLYSLTIITTIGNYIKFNYTLQFF